MKKVVFLANFALVFLEVMSTSADNFKNARHDDINICRGLCLTQAEAEGFRKSQEERKLRNRRDIRLSQQIDEMFNSRQPQNPTDEGDTPIHESQYLTADEEITKYWKGLHGNTSPFFKNDQNKNQSKIFTKRKINKWNTGCIQQVDESQQSERDRENDPLYISDNEDFDAFLKSLSQTGDNFCSSFLSKNPLNQPKVFIEQNSIEDEGEQKYVQYYGKNQKSVTEINPFKVEKVCQSNERVSGCDSRGKTKNRKLHQNTIFRNQSIDESITFGDLDCVSENLFNALLHPQTKRRRIFVSFSEEANNQSSVVYKKPKTKVAQTRERNNIDKWINKIRTNSEKEIIEELKQMKDSSRKKKINVKDEKGNTPLITAVEMEKRELAKYLLKSGAEVNEKDSNRRTALFYALQSNDKNLAKILINNGASMDILKQNNIFERFEPMICSELIVYGTEINNEVIDLKNLVLSGRAYKTQLDNLAKTVNIKSFKLMDDLFIEVIKQGNLEIVKQLIKAGINVNAEDTFQEKALIVALENGYTEIAKLLIKNYADINACSVNGNTALMIALKSEYPDIVSLLLGRRQNINAQNENGDTSLIIAVNQAKDKKDLKNISKLIKRKADINIQNKNGHTALIRAVLKGSVDIIKLLLENGADINIRNKNGKSELLNVLKASKNKGRVMEILVNNCEEARNYKELMDYLSKPVISEEKELRSSWQ